MNVGYHTDFRELKISDKSGVFAAAFAAGKASMKEETKKPWG
jgi:hypothetical protein